MYFEPCPPFFFSSSNHHNKQKYLSSLPYFLTEYLDMPTVGDVKLSLSTNQTNGWYILNGQTIVGDTVAMESAVSLFGSTTLPNYTDHYPSQNDTIGLTFGSNAPILLNQEHLPNVNLPTYWTGVGPTVNPKIFVRTEPAGGYNVSIQSGNNWNSYNTNQMVVRLNPNVQQEIDKTPLTFGCSFMVYLGSSSF